MFECGRCITAIQDYVTSQPPCTIFNRYSQSCNWYARGREIGGSGSSNCQKVFVVPMNEAGMTNEKYNHVSKAFLRQGARRTLPSNPHPDFLIEIIVG